MKKEELRIGNFYQSVKFGIPVSCDLSDLYDLCANAEGATDHPPIDEMFKPITLTEEWLRKFGFVDKFKNDNTTLQEKKHRHHVVIRGGKFYYRVPGVTLTEIYFVHELQSLYYALTKEKLVLAAGSLGKILLRQVKS